MRKLTPFSIRLIIIISTSTIFLCIGWILLKDKMESNEPAQDILILHSDRAMSVDMEPEEEILIQFLSVNYLIDKEYLIRVEIDGEQIGIVYFDENGEIRFDGDREKFEDAIFKAFDARRVK